jgi:hypothetical protein
MNAAKTYGRDAAGRYVLSTEGRAEARRIRTWCRKTGRKSRQSARTKPVSH